MIYTIFDSKISIQDVQILELTNVDTKNISATKFIEILFLLRFNVYEKIKTKKYMTHLKPSTLSTRHQNHHTEHDYRYMSYNNKNFINCYQIEFEHPISDRKRNDGM